jgi:hypothetical protein
MHIPCKKGAFKYKGKKEEKKTLAILYGICKIVVQYFTEDVIVMCRWLLGLQGPIPTSMGSWPLRGGKRKIVGGGRNLALHSK